MRRSYGVVRPPLLALDAAFHVLAGVLVGDVVGLVSVLLNN
jgi:hypothetical protein